MSLIRREKIKTFITNNIPATNICITTSFNGSTFLLKYPFVAICPAKNIALMIVRISPKLRFARFIFLSKLITATPITQITEARNAKISGRFLCKNQKI